MVDSISIRDAVSTDREIIADFNCRLAWETEHKRLDAATIARGVARALASRELCRYFVAELGGAVIGQAMVTYELTDWRDGVLWWFQSVYVLEPHRGRGVFKALFQHIAAAAQADPQVRGLRLYVEQENDRARRVYEQMGLAPSGHLVYERDWTALGNR